MNRYRLLVIVLVVILPISVIAQISNKDSAITMFRQLCSRYSNADHISCDFIYSYKSEVNPHLNIDSLLGKIKMNKGNYHILIGDKEIIHNSNYTITLLKNDKIIYISKAHGGRKEIVNPLFLIDTLLLKIPELNIDLSKRIRHNVVNINFSTGLNYKKVEFIIDAISGGYLLNLKYSVKSTRLINPVLDSAAANNSSQSFWNIVDAYFFHYKNEPFSDTEFDSSKYFTKEGTNYIPTGDFKQYRIIKEPGL